MSINLQSGRFGSKFSFSAINDTVWVFNRKNKLLSWRFLYDLVCYKCKIIYRVIGFRTWCVIRKIQQRGEKLKTPSKVPVFLYDIYISLEMFLLNMTYIIRPLFLERWRFILPLKIWNGYVCGQVLFYPNSGPRLQTITGRQTQSFYANTRL